jgi:hypothetical protein
MRGLRNYHVSCMWKDHEANLMLDLVERNGPSPRGMADDGFCGLVLASKSFTSKVVESSSRGYYVNSVCLTLARDYSDSQS